MEQNWPEKNPAEFSLLGNIENNIKLPDVLPEETPEEYLDRVNSMKLGGIDIYKNPTLNVSLWERLNSLSRNENIKQSKEKQDEVMRCLAVSLKDSNNAGLPTPLPHESFSKEQYPDYFRGSYRMRPFFSRKKENIKTSIESYSAMMLGLDDHAANYEENKKYAEALLENKTIMLFGGGNSALDIHYGTLLEEEKRKQGESVYDDNLAFKPKELINVDPYLREEWASKNRQGFYRSLPLSAADTELVKMNQTGEIPKADEIWALASVPCYLATPEEITDLFGNVTALLEKGGNARISPISCQATSPRAPGTYEERKKAFEDAITKIQQNPEFNVTIFGNSNMYKTIKIHRIK